MSQIYAVIPAFNAESTIAQVIQGVLEQNLPAIVVDDGSADQTSRLAAQAGATVLRHPANQGKGAALQTGFAFALHQQASAVVTLDADAQHAPHEIERLIAAHCQSPDALIIGARSLTEAAMPKWNLVGNRISTFFLRYFSGQPLLDSQSGFRLYPKTFLEKIIPRTRHFETESEMLLLGAKRGFHTCHVAISTLYAPAQKSYFHVARDTWRIITVVLRILKETRRR